MDAEQFKAYRAVAKFLRETIYYEHLCGSQNAKIERDVHLINKSMRQKFLMALRAYTNKKNIQALDPTIILLASNDSDVDRILDAFEGALKLMSSTIGGSDVYVGLLKFISVALD